VPRAKENPEITVVAPSAPLTRRSAWPLSRAVLSVRLTLSAVDVVGFPGVPRSPRVCDNGRPIAAPIEVTEIVPCSPSRPSSSEQFRAAPSSPAPPRAAPRAPTSLDKPRGAPRSPEEPRGAPRSPEEPPHPAPRGDPRPRAPRSPADVRALPSPRPASARSSPSPGSPLRALDRAPSRPASARSSPSPGSPLRALDRAPSRPALPLTSALSVPISPNQPQGQTRVGRLIAPKAEAYVRLHSGG
jgi:hypothetical protein